MVTKNQTRVVALSTAIAFLALIIVSLMVLGNTQIIASENSKNYNYDSNYDNSNEKYLTSDIEARCRGINSKLDTDKDNVADICDNCALEYNPYQEDSNGNGIGDECESNKIRGRSNDIMCYSDNDCEEFDVFEKFCKNDDVFKRLFSFSCINAGTSDSYCVSSESEELFEDCEYDCQNGECIENNQTCSSVCTQGQRVCSGNGFKVCNDYNNDGCFEWSLETDCGYGKSCVLGECVSNPTCSSVCTQGQRVCSGNGFKVCNDYNNDGCFEWSLETDCGYGKSCLLGYCN